MISEVDLTKQHIWILVPHIAKFLGPWRRQLFFIERMENRKYAFKYFFRYSEHEHLQTISAVNKRFKSGHTGRDPARSLLQDLLRLGEQINSVVLLK